MGTTILSFLNLIGCYYQEQMNPVDYLFDEKNKVIVTTKESVYNLAGSDDYFRKNDTLFFNSRTSLDAQSTLVTTSGIPVEQMEKVEVERTNVIATTLLTAAILVIPIAIIVASLLETGSEPPPYYPNHGL